ncbi:hypothetical protein PFISCL1PPCAC_1061, partial [Pristionchus fissidentatus]
AELGQFGLGYDSAGFCDTGNLPVEGCLHVASTTARVGESTDSRSALFVSHRRSGAVSGASSRCSNLHTTHSTSGRTGEVGGLKPGTPIGTDSDEEKKGENLGEHRVEEKRRGD